MSLTHRLLRATVRRTGLQNALYAAAPRIPARALCAHGMPAATAGMPATAAVSSSPSRGFVRALHQTRAVAEKDDDDQRRHNIESRGDPFDDDFPEATLAETVAEHLDDGRHAHAERTAAADEILDELVDVLKEQGFKLIDDSGDDFDVDDDNMHLVRLERAADAEFPHALGVAFDLDEASFVEEVGEDGEVLPQLNEHGEPLRKTDGTRDEEPNAGVQLPLTLYIAPAGAPLETAEDRSRALVIEALTAPDDDLMLERVGGGGGQAAVGAELDFDAMPAPLRTATLNFLLGECGFTQDVVTYANGRAQLHAERKYLRWMEGVNAFLSGEDDAAFDDDE